MVTSPDGGMDILRSVRHYQSEAANWVLNLLKGSLGDERRLLRLQVVAPTGSGKTLIIKLISDALNDKSGRGYSERWGSASPFCLTLSPRVQITHQHREYGIQAATIQQFFNAIKSKKFRQNRRESQVKMTSYLERQLRLGNAFDGRILEAKDNLVIIVDESHYSLDRLTELYKETFGALQGRVKCIVGFSATPRDAKVASSETGTAGPGALAWREARESELRLDLTPKVKDFVARPRGSLIHTHSILTLPYQLPMFDPPMIIFTRSVAVSALLALATNLVHGEGHAAVIVANYESSLRLYVLGAFVKKTEKSPQSSSQQAKTINHSYLGPDRRRGGSRLEGLNHSLDFINSKLFSDNGEPPEGDLAGRRIGVIALLLALGSITSRAGGREALTKLLASTGGGIPDLEGSLIMLSKLYPELEGVFRGGVGGDDEAIREIESIIRKLPVPRLSARRFVAGDAKVAISVSLLEAGLDYPELRTVIHADGGPVESWSKYIQRNGRAARLIRGRKVFYDIVDVNFIDKASSESRRKTIRWRDLYTPKNDISEVFGGARGNQTSVIYKVELEE